MDESHEGAVVPPRFQRLARVVAAGNSSVHRSEGITGEESPEGRAAATRKERIGLTTGREEQERPLLRSACLPLPTL
jgi:hypothetical protein